MTRGTFPAGRWEARGWATAPGDFPQLIPLHGWFHAKDLVDLARVAGAYWRQRGLDDVVVVSAVRHPLRPPNVKETVA